jgi:hypothetical protein
VVRGTLSPDASVERTSWSVKTLQEHTIIGWKVRRAKIVAESDLNENRQQSGMAFRGIAIPL